MVFLYLSKRVRLLTGYLSIALLIFGITVHPALVFAEAGMENAAEAQQEGAPDAETAPAEAAPAEPAPPVRDPITNHLTNWPQMSEINEDSAILMDADNGAILYSLDRDVQRIPASITKIMTCLLTIENTQMDEIVTMTEAGMAEAYGGSSNISPVLGEQFTVEQCLYMLMLKSANDIAAQLAEHVGGSVEAFVQMMNDRCSQIGTTGTHFNNPNGLPGENHYTTAMDMALIMQECLKNDTFRQIISTPTYTVPPTNLTPTERTYENHCKLIIESDTEHYYPYCIGGKTGYTDLAWRTLITAAEKDGRTLICVTLHGPDKTDFTDHKNLFEYGFNSFYTDPCLAEAENGWDISGGVTIPVGFDVQSLTRQETKLENGSIRIDYSYEENPVGSVIKTPKAEDETGVKTETSTGRSAHTDAGSSDAASGAGQTAMSPERVEKKEGSTLTILLVLLVILLGMLAVVVYLLYRNRRKQLEHEEEMRKRKAAARKKRAARRKSSTRIGQPNEMRMRDESEMSAKRTGNRRHNSRTKKDRNL